MAEHRYARLTETINVSEDYADLANEDPLAAVVYMMTWTKCWPWAILPGKPLEFKATVCPGLDVDRERMQAILDILDRRGCIIYYEAPDGTPLRFSCQWHKHNPVRWHMVSLPAHAPPPAWEPPQEFLSHIAQKPGDTMAIWWRSQTGTNGYNAVQAEPTEANRGQTSLAVAVDVDVTAKGKGKGGERAPAPEGDRADGDEAPLPSALPPDLPMRKQNECNLRASLDNALRGRSQATRRDTWFAELEQAIRDYPSDCTEAKLCELLAADPPKAMDRFSDQWLARVMPGLGKPPGLAGVQPGRAQRLMPQPAASHGKSRVEQKL